MYFYENHPEQLEKFLDKNEVTSVTELTYMAAQSQIDRLEARRKINEARAKNRLRRVRKMPQKIATIVVDNDISFKRLEDGRTEISLISHKPLGRNQYAIKDKLSEAGEKLTLSIDKYREKRSLDANKYFLLWQQLL